MSEFLEVARPLALAASKKLVELRQSPLQKERKADHSVVTNADHAADAILRDGIRKAFPQHAILTEESGLSGDPNAEFLWIIDPLDGTRAYVKNVPGYSVMVGLLRQGKPFAGILVDPVESRLYEAQQGEGAFQIFEGQRERLRVSSRTQWDQMPIVTSTGFPDPIAQRIKAVLPSPWIPAINSVGIKVGLVVRNAADIYVNHHFVHYWDTLAPQVVLAEAGGVMTFYDGAPITYDLSRGYQHPGPTLATNGVRHGELLAMLRDFMPRPDDQK